VTSLLLAALLATSAPPADDAAWHRLVGLLQYLHGDYAGAIALKDADEMAEQRGLIAEALHTVDGLGDRATPYRATIESLRVRIDQGVDPTGVSAECQLLAQKILEEQKLQKAPRMTPDLKKGEAVWAVHCALCHGANGDAKTPIAPTLTPPPVSFHDAERMTTLTPYRAFNTSTFGVKGTAMVAFPQLSEDERWALAFFAFTFRQPPCDHLPPAATMQELAQSTDEALAAKYTQAEVACLRRHLPEEKVAGGLFGPARAGIQSALELYAKGNVTAARAAVVDAYLLGIEPVEPMLRARDPEAVRRIEVGFTRTRVAADTGERFVEESTALLKELEKIESAGMTRSGFWPVFFAALLILLREGFEALVVVGALLAVLKKMNAPEQARVVYAAVVAALVLGIFALIFLQKVLAGANREWMETIVSFFAVAMLLYAALWLNARATMSNFMTDLRGQVKTAIGTGSSLALFTVAFTAVARESFETALFVQGLAGDSAEGALWGAGVGLMAVCLMVLVIRKVGFVLPMKTLFSASTALLLATSVMVLGKGLHGLQEVGVLGLTPIPFIELPVLGIFADAGTLFPQIVLACAAFWWWRRSTAMPTKPSLAT
jgi:high-affinity iron transporter